MIVELIRYGAKLDQCSIMTARERVGVRDRRVRTDRQNAHLPWREILRFVEQTPHLCARCIGTNQNPTLGIDANHNEKVDAPVEGLKVDLVPAPISHRELDGSQRIPGRDPI